MIIRVNKLAVSVSILWIKAKYCCIKQSSSIKTIISEIKR